MCYSEGKPPNFATKAAIGMTAGAIGSIIGTPAEVALIRMTSDGRCVIIVFTFYILILVLISVMDQNP